MYKLEVRFFEHAEYRQKSELYSHQIGEIVEMDIEKYNKVIIGTTKGSTLKGMYRIRPPKVDEFINSEDYALDEIIRKAANGPTIHHDCWNPHDYLTILINKQGVSVTFFETDDTHSSHLGINDKVNKNNQVLYEGRNLEYVLSCPHHSLIVELSLKYTEPSF